MRCSVAIRQLFVAHSGEFCIQLARFNSDVMCCSSPPFFLSSYPHLPLLLFDWKRIYDFPFCPSIQTGDSNKRTLVPFVINHAVSNGWHQLSRTQKFKSTLHVPPNITFEFQTYRIKIGFDIKWQSWIARTSAPADRFHRIFYTFQTSLTDLVL